ncbi:MAG: TatD family hydrolase [Fusobacteriaceae bacterium]
MSLKYVDTHCHIDADWYDEDRENILQHIEANMDFVVNIGCNIPSSKTSISFAKKYKNIYSTVGVHPTEINGEFSQNIYDEIKNLILAEKITGKIVAVGEIGLDYHHMTQPKELQKNWFRGQLKIADELKMPVVIHTRDATHDTLEILQEFKNVGGIVHCYPGSYEPATEIMDRFYFGIGGVVTFKSARKTFDAVKQIPLENLVIETDSPYLAPEPFRSKRNLPEYTKYVVEKIASIKDIPVSKVLEITTNNARKIYKIL